jgi:hypothetical protein
MQMLEFMARLPDRQHKTCEGATVRRTAPIVAVSRARSPVARSTPPASGWLAFRALKPSAAARQIERVHHHLAMIGRFALAILVAPNTSGGFAVRTMSGIGSSRSCRPSRTSWARLSGLGRCSRTRTADRSPARLYGAARAPRSGCDCVQLNRKRDMFHVGSTIGRPFAPAPKAHHVPGEAELREPADQLLRQLDHPGRVWSWWRWRAPVALPW